MRASKKKKRIFLNKKSCIALCLICVCLFLLLIGYSWFQENRPTLHLWSEWTFVDTLIQNSDMILAVVFLILTSVPFYLVFDKRKAQARDLVPVALMAALCVVGRVAFSIIPLPNFKPVTAIIMITAIAFGPESGYLTGALAALLSNFLFGQGPWTPWQMFTWGILGLLTGCLYRTGVFGVVGQAVTDHRGKRKKPVVLCVTGFVFGILYGWIMNLQYLIGYIRPLNLHAIAITYLQSMYYDISHGICTALVLWFAAEPWVRKMLRIKKKFGLEAEDQSYRMPTSDVHEIEDL